jgi:hypothetical protein
MKFSLVFIAICAVIVVIFSFQNCSDIHVSGMSSEGSLQCTPPDDIGQYSIALYGQTPSSDKFEIVDSHGQATGTEAEWFVDNVSQGNHVIYEDLFNGATGCTPKTITAKFSVCDVQYILTQNISFGPNCQPVIITDPPPPWGESCPAGRYTRGQVEIYGCGATNGCPATLNNQDLTKFETILGRVNPSDTPVLFPGAPGAYTYLPYMPRDKYISAKFHTPAVGTPYGFYSAPEFFAADRDVAISTSCGDFNPADINCKRTGVLATASLSWRVGSTSPAACNLAPNTDYYLNIRVSDPHQTGSYCNNNGCNIGILNQFHP